MCLSVYMLYVWHSIFVHMDDNVVAILFGKKNIGS